MKNGLINIEPERLRQAATRLNSVKQTMSDVASALKAVENQVPNAWTSNATSEYEEYMSKVAKKAQTIYANINSIQKNLQSTASKVEEVEKQIQQIWGR